MDNYGDYGYSPTVEQSRQSNKGKLYIFRANPTATFSIIIDLETRIKLETSLLNWEPHFQLRNIFINFETSL